MSDDDNGPITPPESPVAVRISRAMVLAGTAREWAEMFRALEFRAVTHEDSVVCVDAVSDCLTLARSFEELPALPPEKLDAARDKLSEQMDRLAKLLGETARRMGIPLKGLKP